MDKEKKKKYLIGGRQVANHFTTTYKYLEYPVLKTRYACELLQEGLIPSEPGKPYRLDVSSGYPADPNVNIEGYAEHAEEAGVTVKTIKRWEKRYRDLKIDRLWPGGRPLNCVNSFHWWLNKHRLARNKTWVANLKKSKSFRYVGPGTP